MMQEKAPSKKLSKAVLELKFMKKSKEKALMQEENEEREQLYHDQLSMLHEGAEKIVMINSYVDCLKFLPCRLSFGGMDQDIEKLNEERLSGLYTMTKPPSKENITEMDADVSAKDMAAQYRPRAHRPTAAQDSQGQEEGADDYSYDATPNKPSQDQKPKSGKMRPIFQDGFEGGGDRGRGGFRDRGRPFSRRGRGGRGQRGGRGHWGSRGHRGGRGGRDGGFAGGRGREMYVKEEGFWGGKDTMKGCLGESTSRGKSKGNKRGHEGSQGHIQDSNSWDNKKFKSENN